MRALALLSLRIATLLLLALAAAAELCTLTTTISPRPVRAKAGKARLTFAIANNRKFAVPNGAFELTLPAGASYLASKVSKGHSTPTVNGQVVQWTNLAFKPRQKRVVKVVVGLGTNTGTLSFPATAFKTGPAPYRDDDSIPGCDGDDATVTVVIS